MKKHFFPLGLAVGLLSSVGLTSAQAGILGDITDAVIGHTKDFAGRLGADEVLQDAEVVRTGSFRADDPGNDIAHRGSGEVSLVRKDGEYYLQFHPSFNSSFAPDPTVYVNKAAKVVDKASFEASERKNLGSLKKGSGASYVKIEGFDPGDVGSVTIWCERFGAFITNASFM